MEVKWLGHACFKLSYGGRSLVIDPYEPGSIPGLADVRETADRVLCTHGHYDHCYEAGVHIVEDACPEAFQVTELTVSHDDQGGRLRGLTKIYLIEAEGLKIAHFGDIGCELTPEQKELFKDLDLVLVPVGGYYTIDGIQAAAMVKELAPRTTIPMHYTGTGYGFDEISGVDVFLSQFDEGEVHWIKGSSIIVGKEADCRVVVPEKPALA